VHASLRSNFPILHTERIIVPEPVEWGRLTMAVCAAVAMLALGFSLRLVLRRLSRRAEGTRWAWDDLIARLLCDLAVILCLIGGLWIGTLILQFQPGVRNVIGQVLVAVLIFAVSLATARLAAGIVGSIAMARSGVAQSVTIFANITRTVVLVIGILVLLQSLGVSITPMLTALGVGGLAVALALQDTLANLFAGVHILASKTIVPGDFVRLSTGQEGHDPHDVGQPGDRAERHVRRRDPHQLPPARAGHGAAGPGQGRL
jgi:small-conductance mechanosensitive channel